MKPLGLPKIRLRHASGPEDAASQTISPKEAASKGVRPPGATHRREVSNISDFAYLPGQGGFTGNPSNHERDHPDGAETTKLANVVSNVTFESLQTTAVNSDRECSEASSNKARRHSLNRENERLDRLRKIVSAAQPGVTVNINIHTEGLASQQGVDFEAVADEHGRTTPSTWKQFCMYELRAWLAPWSRLWDAICQASGVLLAIVSVVIGVVLTVSMALPIISLIAFCLDKIWPLGDDNAVSNEHKQPFLANPSAQKTCNSTQTQRQMISSTGILTLVYSVALVCSTVYFGSQRWQAQRNRTTQRQRIKNDLVAWRVAWEQSKEEANALRGK